jgi:hypothetical protein
MMETDPVSEALLFSSYLEFQMMDKVQKPSDSGKGISLSSNVRILK